MVRYAGKVSRFLIAAFALLTMLRGSCMETHANQIDEIKIVHDSLVSQAYLLPFTYGYILKPSDISDFTQQELCYARNEIYARHGRKFNSSELTEYYSIMPWYDGRIDPEEFRDDDYLSDTDKKNLQMIEELENSKYGGRYELDQSGYNIFAARTLGSGSVNSIWDVVLGGRMLQLPTDFAYDLDNDGSLAVV